MRASAKRAPIFFFLTSFAPAFIDEGSEQRDAIRRAASLGESFTAVHARNQAGLVNRKSPEK